MLSHQFRAAFRYLIKNKGYSLLNIIGLTIGLTACWLVLLYVQRETSYDHFHKNGAYIFRAATDIITPKEKQASAFSAGALAIDAKQTFPEISSAVRIAPASLLFIKGNIKYQQDNCLFVDSSFFKVFDYPMIASQSKHILTKPYEVVLSESAAKKYFGSENPVGQTMLLSSGKFTVQVTGVMKDLPQNSQIKADILLSMPTIYRFGDSTMDQNWTNVNFQTYLLLQSNADYKQLEAKLNQLIGTKAGKLMQQRQTQYKIRLEPIEDIYLHSTRIGSVSGNLTQVYTFALIGFFILLLACINFINLSTARSTERAKEVGIKKLIGAKRGRLINQFLSESTLLSLFSFLLSVLLTSILLPLLNQLAGKQISTGITEHPMNFLILIVISLFIGILAGAYPALVLSNYKPITVLKGSFSTSRRGLTLRRSLVIVQFSICICMIISTIIVYSQLRYMQNSNLGFNNDQILIIDTHWDQNRLSYRDQLESLPQISSIAMTSNVPGDEKTLLTQISMEDPKGLMKTTSIHQLYIDFNFIPAFKMQLIAGRNFMTSFRQDSSQAMIINERLVHYLGYQNADQVIGQRYSQGGQPGTIVGVLKDFHFRSFKEDIAPLSFRILPDGWRYLCLKINTDNLPTTLHTLENIWKTTIPQRPFSYYFADDYFNQQYLADQNFGKLFISFSFLTIIISCLGLIGLSSYSVLQRKKEIGVRKLLGASTMSIIKLLTLEFIKLITVAFILASLMIWVPINHWLEGFSYHSAIHWWVFLVSGGMIILIALSTVSLHVINAARAKPVQNLKTTE